MQLTLPRVAKLLYAKKQNEVWQYYNSETILNDIEVLNTSPFTIKSDGITYVLTSNKDFVAGEEVNHVLLTSKKPTRNDLNANQIFLKRWLKHPAFLDLTPEQVITTWKDNFKFIKENEEQEKKGLRPPQIGALYSILAHIQNPEDKAIIVMPTGTGKTETMLATLIANECKKLLVSVPSDSLRIQISQKFITLVY